MMRMLGVLAIGIIVGVAGALAWHALITAPRHHAAMGHGDHDTAHAGGEHDHGSHSHGEAIDLAGGPSAPTLGMELLPDPAGGWNLHVLTRNFRFAPENVNGEHVAGEGHAHVYVDGEKIARIYGPWFHIDRLPEGASEVTVTLNANDHRELAVDGAPLSVTKALGNS